MFLDCINNFYGKKDNSVIQDIELSDAALSEGDAKLFDSVFASYIPFISDSDKIKVNDEHKDYFLGLENLYRNISWDDSLSGDEELADALMFYISSGLVTKENNEFYVDSTELIKKSHEYQCYRNNRKGLK